jgi:hypothetical protein
VVIEGGLYHVYNRFARGEDVFADPEEAVAFVELLREVKQRDGLTVFAWALLSNHFHVALRTSPLFRAVRQRAIEPASPSFHHFRQAPDLPPGESVDSGGLVSFQAAMRGGSLQWYRW